MYVAAAAIILGSLLYSRYLANQLEEKERQTIELKANAIYLQNVKPDYETPSPFEQEAQGFVFNIIRKDDQVPWILTDEDFVFTSGRNILRLAG